MDPTPQNHQRGAEPLFVLGAGQSLTLTLTLQLPPCQGQGPGFLDSGTTTELSVSLRMHKSML